MPEPSVRPALAAGLVAAGCGHGVAYHHRRRLIEECAACGRQHSLLAGTIFEQTKTGLARWFLAIWLVTSSKGGISAMELQRQMGFSSYQTAWSWLHKIRKAMVAPGRAPLAARVEADETLLGGARPGKPGRGAPDRGRRCGRGGTRQGPQAPARPAAAAAVADASAESLEAFLAAQRGAARRGDHRRLAGLCRAGRGRLRPRRDQSQPHPGATPCCACPPSTSSSASPSAGCSARTMARSARSTFRPISTSTSSACMGLRVSSFECRHRVPSCVEFISVAAAQPRFGARRSEGSSPSGADHRATSLYPVDPWGSGP